MDVEIERLLTAIAQHGGKAKSAPLPVASREQDKARTKAKNLGWAKYDHPYWIIADAGRAALAPIGYKEMLYAWSVNEEEYHGSEDTREAAIQAAIGGNDLAPGQKVWTGEIVKRSAGYYLTSADRLLEDMQDRAHEHHGEYSEEWLTKVSGEQERDLDLTLKAAVDAWAEKQGHCPFFYEIDNTIEHDVTAALEEGADA